MNEVAEPGDFEPLLDYLKRTRGFDFTAYKRPSLMRRIQKRMQGKKLDRTRSIADISNELGITEDQSAAIRSALDGLGKHLDKVDSKLVAKVEKILNPEQLAKVRTWL